MRHFILAGVLALACLQPALAQDACKPLQMLGSAGLDIAGDSVIVNVTINGKPAKLLLAPSGGTTRFTPDGAAALGLTPIANSRVILINSKSKSSESYVVIDDMSVGGAHIAHSQFMISPANQSGGSGIVGVMGADLLSHFDVELDFAAGKMNLFSQDHCPGKVIYWKHAAVSMVPLSEFRATANDSRTGYQGYLKRFEQMWVPVTLDGKSISAQLSTSSNSFMQASMALAAFGVDAKSPGSRPMENPMASPDTFDHRFSSLVFDGVTVTNPDFTVFPLNPAAFTREIRRTDTRLARLDDGEQAYIVIGMNILSKLHLFASFGEHRLYITEASGPPHSAPAAP
jgi:hypothetical protein